MFVRPSIEARKPLFSARWSRGVPCPTSTRHDYYAVGGPRPRRHAWTTGSLGRDRRTDSTYHGEGKGTSRYSGIEQKKNTKPFVSCIDHLFHAFRSALPLDHHGTSSRVKKAIWNAGKQRAPIIISLHKLAVVSDEEVFPSWRCVPASTRQSWKSQKSTREKSRPSYRSTVPCLA